MRLLKKYALNKRALINQTLRYTKFCGFLLDIFFVDWSNNVTQNFVHVRFCRPCTISVYKLKLTKHCLRQNRRKIYYK